MQLLRAARGCKCKEMLNEIHTSLNSSSARLYLTPFMLHSVCTSFHLKFIPFVLNSICTSLHFCFWEVPLETINLLLISSRRIILHCPLNTIKLEHRGHFFFELEPFLRWFYGVILLPNLNVLNLRELIKHFSFLKLTGDKTGNKTVNL